MWPYRHGSCGVIIQLSKESNASKHGKESNASKHGKEGNASNHSKEGNTRKVMPVGG